ncbi:hypothetical protein NQZ68_037149 [Dissostichus eleginoides]|nr:hypothetical protein NQZ68_037149 [Dissostichus eleginoides]
MAPGVSTLSSELLSHAQALSESNGRGLVTRAQSHGSESVWAQGRKNDHCGLVRVQYCQNIHAHTLPYLEIMQLYLMRSGMIELVLVLGASALFIQ